MIVLVADRVAAAGELYERTGLASVEGGVHPGHGTGNRIVPLGPDYVELMTVVDAAEAEGSPVGRWATAGIAAGGGVAALCLRTDDIEGVAARIGSPPLAMSRATPDGGALSWRLAGLDQALTHGLPFFIQWDGDDLPGATPVSHRVEPGGIAWVEWSGDADLLHDRLDGADLDIRVVDGPVGPRRIGITMASGVIVL